VKSKAFSVQQVCDNAAAAPNAAPVSSPTVSASSSAQLSTDKTSYASGEVISLTFALSFSLAAVDNFVAIFPASTSASQLKKGLLWLWVCNRQGLACGRARKSGTVSFDSDVASWGSASQWPLAQGMYKAYLVRTDSSASFWPVLAQSAKFTVGPSQPVASPVIAPTATPAAAPVVPPAAAPLVPPTAAPVVPPTSAPVVQPTQAPVDASVSEHLAAQAQIKLAKQDLMQMIQANPRLAPLFLR
jgi:hypothetical protein